MARLICSSIRCVQTTDGAGDDDIYMIVFRAAVSPEVKVVGGAGTEWGSQDTGQAVAVREAVLDQNYQTGNSYVVALLEQDYAIDIKTGVTSAKISEFWANTCLKAKTDWDRENLAFLSLIWFGGLDNDVLVSVPHTIPQIFTDGGIGIPVTFNSNGWYRARFVKRS